MRVRLLFSLTLMMALGIQLRSQVSTAQNLDPNMRLKKADSKGIIWFDPREAPLEVTGLEWIKEEGIYRRLPAQPAWEIREAVDALANHTAGAQIRFRSDCKRIVIEVELKEKSGMYHMPATGQSGFDLYFEQEGKQRYFRTTRFHRDSIRYTAELFRSENREMRSFTLNFPLYNCVNSVLVGVDQGALVEAPPAHKQAGKIVFYGTSITQGGCVGRPGMAYTNILSRGLDMQVVNLGFSGNGRGEAALARLITQIPEKKLVILDYEANAGNSIRETLGPFVEILRESHPQLPILIMSRIPYAYDRKGSKSYMDWVDRRDFQRDLVEQSLSAGDDHIYFLDGSTVLGKDYDECTVDGVHPNDLGSMRIADALQPVIEHILSEHND